MVKEWLRQSLMVASKKYVGYVSGFCSNSTSHRLCQGSFRCNPDVTIHCRCPLPVEECHGPQPADIRTGKFAKKEPNKESNALDPETV